MKLLVPLFLLLLWLTQSSQKTPVYIGGFFPLSPNKASVPGRALLAAAELALDHVKMSDVLRDYELRMIVKDSKVRIGRFTRYDFCLRLSHSIFRARAARVMEKSYTISMISNCPSLRLS